MKKSLVILLIVLIIIVVTELILILRIPLKQTALKNGSAINTVFTYNDHKMPINFYSQSDDKSTFIFLAKFKKIQAENDQLLADFSLIDTKGEEHIKSILVYQSNDVIPFYIQTQSTPRMFPTSSQYKFIIFKTTNQVLQLSKYQNQFVLLHLTVTLPAPTQQDTLHDLQIYKEYKQHLACNRTLALQLEQSNLDQPLNCSPLIKEMQVYVP